jgi:hypothetical protein
MKTPKLKVFSAEPRIPCSVKPKNNTRKVEDLEEFLLKQVIAEAKLFGRTPRTPGRSTMRMTTPGVQQSAIGRSSPV